MLQILFTTCNFVTMIPIKENYSLKPFNTFGFEVSAAYFVEINSIETLQKVLQLPLAKEKQLFILGGGSNLLLTKNLDALVLKIELKGITLLESDDTHALVACGAGEIWHEFVLKTIDLGLSGLENLSLIPGCVGASPMQNIGAYGAEIKDTFEYLEALDIQSLKIVTFTNEACKFGYRESVFKNEYKGQYIITKVVFKLSKKPIVNTKYGAINDELLKMGITVSYSKRHQQRCDCD